jgi:hypothetical protein
MLLFGSIQSVSCITKAWQYVTLLVQALIKGTGKDIDIRMCLLQAFDAFRAGNHAQKPDMRGTFLLDDIDRSGDRPASSEHRIDNEHSMSAMFSGSLQ